MPEGKWKSRSKLRVHVYVQSFQLLSLAGCWGRVANGFGSCLLYSPDTNDYIAASYHEMNKLSKTYTTA
eukprot:3959439-Amphidinium_carterae.1